MSHRSSKPKAFTDEAAPAADRKSGRVAFDADGRGVWEWQVETGVFTRTVTQDQLMDLAATNLQIVETPLANSEHCVRPYGPDRVRAELDSSTRQPTGRPVPVIRTKASVPGGPVLRLLKRLARAD